MTDIERVIDKVQKLHAHAESADKIGNEAEAQAFAVKVQELLTRYKLSMSEIEYACRDKTDSIGQVLIDWETHGMKKIKARCGWLEALARIVARAYYCRFVTMYGTNSLLIIGREQDRAVAEFMLVTIARFLDKISAEEHRRYHYKVWTAAGKPSSGAAPNARGFRIGFKIGFIKRLGERFDEEIRIMTRSPEVSNCTAIVRLENTITEIDAWMKSRGGFSSVCSVNIAVGYDKGSREGLQRGRRAADEINLRARAVEEGRPGRTDRLLNT